MVRRRPGDPQHRRPRRAHDLHGEVRHRDRGLPGVPELRVHDPDADRTSAATPLPDGRIAFGTVGADGATYLAAGDITGDPPAVGPLECQGGLANDSPGVAAGSSFAAVFVRAWDNSIWQRTFTGTSAGTWQALPIGGATYDGPSAP